jgi:hypothetical protein
MNKEFIYHYSDIWVDNDDYCAENKLCDIKSNMEILTNDYLDEATKKVRSYLNMGWYESLSLKDKIENIQIISHNP